MSQELIEEIKSPYITFDEFIPTWTQLVEDGNGNLSTPRQRELYKVDITNSHMCVIGEAHGNSREYCNSIGNNYCKICDGISHNHSDSPIKINVFGAVSNKGLFLQLKKYLYAHMIDYHPEKMLK